jgi:copper chaperone NosL
MNSNSTTVRRPHRRLARPWCAGLTALLLAACAQTAAPIAAHEPGLDAACALDGMMLQDFPGPKAQLQFADGKPDFFCDMTEMFAVILAPEQKRHLLGMFVQDAGKTDWNRPSGHWIDAKTALFVVGSKKAGSMGPTFGAFSSAADAAAFIAKEGGRVLPFDQITLDMIGKHANAKHASALRHLAGADQSNHPNGRTL